jgi:hypothetical protein
MRENLKKPSSFLLCIIFRRREESGLERKIRTLGFVVSVQVFGTRLLCGGAVALVPEDG